MPLTLRVETDNAAFEGADAGPELARILRSLADRVAPMQATGEESESGPVIDANGNRVGRWAVSL